MFGALCLSWLFLIQCTTAVAFATHTIMKVNSIVYEEPFVLTIHKSCPQHLQNLWSCQPNEGANDFACKQNFIQDLDRKQQLWLVLILKTWVKWHIKNENKTHNLSRGGKKLNYKTIGFSRMQWTAKQDYDCSIQLFSSAHRRCEVAPYKWKPSTQY